MSNNSPIGTISSVSEQVSITDTELGLGPIPPYTRNWEFEKNLLPMQAGDVPATYADIEDLMKNLDFKPSIPIEVGIGRFVSWYHSYYKV